MNLTSTQDTGTLSTAQIRSIFEWESGPWSVKVTDIITTDRFLTIADGKIFYEGAHVGSFSREWRKDSEGGPWLMHHGSLMISDGTFDPYERQGEDFRRRGFTRAWTAHCEPRYAEAGFEAITLVATGEGTVAWAKMGFEADGDKEWRDALESAEWKLSVAASCGRLTETEATARRAQLEKVAAGPPDLLALDEIYCDAANTNSLLYDNAWCGRKELR